MTQILEKARIVRAAIPSVRVVTSVGTLSLATTATTLVQVQNLAEAAYSIASHEIDDEDVFYVLSTDAFAEDWNSPEDSIYDDYLKDADVL